MNIAKLVVVSSILSLSVIGAQAEEYEGVLQFSPHSTRADVHVDAVAAARAPDPYTEGANAGQPQPFVSKVARKSVRAEAVATTRAGNLYGEGRSSGLSMIAANAPRHVLQAAAASTRTAL